MEPIAVVQVEDAGGIVAVDGDPVVAVDGERLVHQQLAQGQGDGAGGRVREDGGIKGDGVAGQGSGDRLAQDRLPAL